MNTTTKKGNEMNAANDIDTTTPPREFIVKTASAKMPNSCWGKYGRVAVLEVEPGTKNVSMISDRARGVVRVIATWEKCFVGESNECAFERACAEAEDLAERLTALAIAERALAVALDAGASSEEAIQIVRAEIATYTEE